MKKIVLIIPYFGKFRPDFLFWLKSVSDNSTVDFLLLTDNVVDSCPTNLHVVHLSFEEVKAIIQSLFDFKICLPTPYKLCDFKPCYGEAFASYIGEYDFWGFTDMDMVYGDIRKYITDGLLSSYDRILGYGHFSLFRNVPEINSLYKHVEQPTYRQVFTYPCGCAFDEYWGLSGYMDKVMSDRFYQACPFDDVDCMKYAFHSHKKKLADKGKSNIIYSYDNGKLYKISRFENQIFREETMYVHFQKRVMGISTEPSDKFMMVPNSFIPYIDNLSLENLKSFDVSGNFYPRKYKLFMQRVISKLKKIVANRECDKNDIPVLLSDNIKYYKD